MIDCILASRPSLPANDFDLVHIDQDFSHATEYAIKEKNTKVVLYSFET